MQIAVISDLHLGVGVADSFGHSDIDFLGFLKRLESDFEKIILLGDIWETLTAMAPYKPRQALKNARQAHPELAQRFECYNYLYVHGNHDIITELEGIPSEAMIESDGVKLLFTHGHHHDWYWDGLRWVPEFFVWLGAWARRVGLKALYDICYALDIGFSKPSTHPMRDSFQRWAYSLAHHRDADVVVTGHTHHAMVSEHGSVVFLNSGNCSEGKYSYLAIDTKRDLYAVC
jgi:predicted phosphodiesterase